MKKLYLASLLLVMSLPGAWSQIQITGLSPVISGVNYGPYTISGLQWSTSDHWCVTGGTLNNTSNTCVNDDGTPSVSVTWTSSGTLSYYQGAMTTPVATLAVTVYPVSNTVDQSNTEFAPDYYPYVPLNQLYTINLTGSAVSVPPGTVTFQWQESLDGTNYTGLPNSNSQNYCLSQVFTQPTTWIRRYLFISLQGRNYTYYSNQIMVNAAAPVQAGVISPALLTPTSGTTYFTVTPATGGSMCGPGNYNYVWQTSRDNLNWTNVGTGLTYTPGVMAFNDYVRVLAYCGPIAGISNIAYLQNVINNGPLQGGVISPMSIMIAAGTGPGNLTGNPASGGNTGPAGYVYNWQYSTDGVNFSSFSTPIRTLNYNPGNLSATTYFRRQVSIADGEQAVSNTVQINVGTAVPYGNYIMSKVVTAGGITSLASADALSALTDVKQTTAYFDGMGWPVQTVAKQGSLLTSTSPTDIVFPMQHDLTGKQVFDYLPYVSTGSDGSFKRNALPEQNAFNASLFNTQQEHFYYGQTNYEASPLARVNSSSAAGDSWTGSNKNMQHLYTGNTLADQVMIWNVTNSGTVGVFGSYTSNTGYAAGSLYKNITTDENGNQVIEFKDLKGNVILKKVQVSGTSDDGTGTGYTGWMCTYYIYDDWNNLRCVIQPHGVELLIQNAWNMSALSNVILNEQCFRYEYDQRNRLIMKQVPGTGPVYMIYDNLDRIVMTQDAHLRATTGQWLTTLYETALDRPVATGLFTTSSGFASLLSAAAASPSYPFTLAGAPAYPAWELLTLSHYDDYTGIPSGISSTLNLSAINSANFYSSYNTSPVYAQPLTQSTPATAVNSRGLVTWTQTEVLGSGGTQYISSANLYDTRARVIQQQTLNYSGGLDIITTQYNFVGKPLIIDLRHQKLITGGPTQTYEVVSRNSYDALERPVMVEKMLINSLIPSPAWKTISTMAYDALGRLTTKTVGNNPGSTGSPYVPLETQAFEYNIRNWLLGVNRNFINSSTPTNYFGFELGYDKSATIVPATTYTTQQFNGNIGGTVWKNGGDAAVRKYDFTYDAANRLTKADFNQYNSSFNKNDGLNFSVTGLGYDANGNITNMTQMGWNGSGSNTPIDQLAYTPVTNTNRLQNVMDTYSDQNTTLGDFRYSTKYTAALAGPKSTATVDYSYDNNGNLTADKNKDITSISYNYLNLPTTITIAGQTATGTINYVYDAAGNKLAKTINEPSGTAAGVTGTSITTTTTYIAGFEYKSLQYGASSLASLQFKDNLQSFGQEEGRVRALYTNATSPTLMTGFAFDYLLKDHLGNTRAVITEEAETDPYPTLTFEGATSSDVANQNAIWDNSSGQSINVLSSRISPLPIGFTAPANGTYCGSVTKAQGAIGAAKLIRVMARDQLNVSIDYTYSSATVDNSNANGLNTLLNSLAAMILSSGQVSQALKPQTMAGTFAANQNNSTVSNFLSVVNQEVPGSPSGPPKAYLHVLLFNDQFVFDNANSVVVPITSAGLNARQSITQVITIPKNGYAYIYFSNESNTIVYFDNFALTDVRGPLLETTDYYPFGLTMAGISDKTLKSQYAQNKYRYNSKELQNQEFSDGTGLEEYDYGARFFDPQLGRFFTMDKFAEKYYGINPYQYAANNPINTIDIHGDSIWVNIGNQQYYFGTSSEGGYGLYSSDGKKYDGDDQFANKLSAALTGYANTNDQEVQDRLGAMMSSNFKILVEPGANETGQALLNNDDTKREKITDPNFDINNPNITGIVVNWNEDFRNKADGIKNKNGSDPDLDLAHELLGHGFQAMIRQLQSPDKADNIYKDGEGWFARQENDAQLIKNKVAVASNRKDMVSPTYTSDRNPNHSRYPYHLQPLEIIKWNKNKKY